jgi:hypothetical protein
MNLKPAPVLPPLPAADYQELRESVRLLGVQVPLIVTSDLVIIDGHER